MKRRLSPGYVNNATEFSENVDITGQSVSLPMVHLISCAEECDSDSPSQDQPCITPSSCVDVFLAYTLENADNPSGSPDFYLKRTTKLPQDRHGDSSRTKSTDEIQMQCCKEDLAQAHPHTSAVLVNKFMDDCMDCSASTDLHDLHSKQATALPQALQNDSSSTRETILELHVSNLKKFSSSKPAVSLSASYQAEQGNVPASDETMEINETSTNEQLGPLSKSDTINIDSFTVPASDSRHEQNPMDQYETDNP